MVWLAMIGVLKFRSTSVFFGVGLLLPWFHIASSRLGAAHFQVDCSLFIFLWRGFKMLLRRNSVQSYQIVLC